MPDYGSFLDSIQRQHQPLVSCNFCRCGLITFSKGIQSLTGCIKLLFILERNGPGELDCREVQTTTLKLTVKIQTAHE